MGYPTQVNRKTEIEPSNSNKIGIHYLWAWQPPSSKLLLMFGHIWRKEFKWATNKLMSRLSSLCPLPDKRRGVGGGGGVRNITIIYFNHSNRFQTVVQSYTFNQIMLNYTKKEKTTTKYELHLANHNLRIRSWSQKHQRSEFLFTFSRFSLLFSGKKEIHISLNRIQVRKAEQWSDEVLKQHTSPW